MGGYEKCCTWPEASGQRLQKQYPRFLMPKLLLFLLPPAFQVPKSWYVSIFVESLGNLLWHLALLCLHLSPPSLHPHVSLSVPGLMLMLREPGSYTILHSITLQWPVAHRPPWRMAFLLTHNSVILPCKLSEITAQPLYGSLQKLWDES